MANAIAERRRTAASKFEDALADKIDVIADLLPHSLRTQAPRLVKRAAVLFATNPSLKKCTAASFATAVLKAAEFGLAIDGRLGYAVPYKDQAQFIPSWMGLLAVARRAGTIESCKTDVVCDGDGFHYEIIDGRPSFKHSPRFDGPRDNVTHAYSILYLPKGGIDVEVMGKWEIDRIRNEKSRASRNGPWVTDYNEMAKKTVFRRQIKRFAEDPSLIELMQYDDETSGVSFEDERSRSRVAISPLNDLIDHDNEPEALEAPDDVIDEPAAPPTQPAAKSETKAAPATELFDGDDPREFRHVLEEGDVKEAERRISACVDPVRLLEWGQTIANSELTPDVVKRLGKLVDARVKKVEAGA